MHITKSHLNLKQRNADHDWKRNTKETNALTKKKPKQKQKEIKTNGK